MSSPKESTEQEVNQAVERVASKKEEWAKLPAGEKAALLTQCLENLKTQAELWARNACLQIGYDFNNPKDHGHLIAETFLKGPAFTGNWINGILQSLKAIAATGEPPKPAAVERRPNGSFAVTVFPKTIQENVFSGGIKYQVITSTESKGVVQTNPTTLKSGVVAILGAGNYDAPNDILHMLFLANKVAVFKPNPVNDFTAENTFAVFKPLIDRGYLAYVYGAAKVGQQLVNHQLIEEVTMTGSCLTYDAIVWGGASKKPQPESKQEPLLKKPVTAELGSVNPYIITPGNWSASQINAHAEQLVAAKMLNNGHICASPQVLVTCKNWPQREAFLAAVRRLLQSYPGTKAYYPQCDRSYKEQLDRLAQAVGQSEEKIIFHNPNLFQDKQQNPIFADSVPKDSFVVQREAFCPVLAEVPLDTAPNAGAFLPEAVEFANKKIWGSLTCTLICDSVSEKTYKNAVEKALDDLQFGSIGFNQTAAFSVLFAQMPWGAYPRHSIHDIQSGTGKLGNSLCVNDVVKCVMRAPFIFPSMGKVKTNGVGAVVEARRVTDYFIHYNFYRLFKVLSYVLTGL